MCQRNLEEPRVARSVDFLSFRQLFEEGVSFVSLEAEDSVFSFEEVSVEGVESFPAPEPEEEEELEEEDEEPSPFRA